jgi:hypothetical protein
MPTGETQKVFLGGALGDGFIGTLRKRLFNYAPVKIMSILSSGSATNVFSPANLKTRSLSERSRNWVDRVLHQERMRALHEGHNLWKTPTQQYTKRDIEQSRIVCKNLNGIQLLGDDFREMYPDATFLCLVRHPLALAEGRLRRGQDIDRVVEQLLTIGHKMKKDLDSYDNYHLLKFENMLSSPYQFLTNLYQLTDLSLSDVKYVRFQNKATINRHGSHDIQGTDRSVIWYPIEDMEKHIKVDVNANQFANMTTEIEEKLMTELKPLISGFCY